MAVDGINSEASLVADLQPPVAPGMRVHCEPSSVYLSGLNCQAVTGTELVMW